MSARTLTQMTWPKKMLLGATALCVVAAPVLLGQLDTSTDWERAAGGKMSFDVASIKRHPYDPASRAYYPRANFSLSENNSYKPTGGLLSTEDMPVNTYVRFAYKLTGYEASRLEYPTWARDEHFDIEARAPANATKDQMRLMMQSLLAARFKLAVHWENRKTPVYSVTLAKMGKTGPQFLPSADPPCTDMTNPALRTDSNGVTRLCGQPGMLYLPNGEDRQMGRNESMQAIAQDLGFMPGNGLGRPVTDGTGLAGAFDYLLVWAPEPQPGQPAVDGPSFLDALRDQLGLKLVPATAQMPFLILDHIEEPTPN